MRYDSNENMPPLPEIREPEHMPSGIPAPLNSPVTPHTPEIPAHQPSGPEVPMNPGGDAPELISPGRVYPGMPPLPRTLPL